MWYKFSKKTRYYHASPKLFKPGDYISPNLPNYKPNFNHSQSELIYLTDSPKPHYTVAQRAINENWYIYEVEPIDPKRVWIQKTFDELVTDRPCIVKNRLGSARGIGRPKSHQKNTDLDEIYKERIQEAKDAMKNEKTRESYMIENGGSTPEEDIEEYQNKIKYKNPDSSYVKYKRRPYTGLPKKQKTKKYDDRHSFRFNDGYEDLDS